MFYSKNLKINVKINDLCKPLLAYKKSKGLPLRFVYITTLFSFWDNKRCIRLIYPTSTHRSKYDFSMSFK